MLGFDTSRASSDSRGCPAAPEPCGGFCCCNMITLSLTGNGWTASPANLASLSRLCKTQPLNWGVEGKLPVRHFCSDLKCLSAKVLSLSLLK